MQKNLFIFGLVLFAVVAIVNCEPELDLQAAENATGEIKSTLEKAVDANEQATENATVTDSAESSGKAFGFSDFCRALSKKVANKPVKNRDLGNGVLRWTRFKLKQRNSYRFKNAKAKKPVKPAKKPAKVAITVVKQIGGAKNGGTRVVRVKKNRASYATKAKVMSRPTRNYFKKHTRYTRRTLVPGKVLILLAGRHKGKRVVLLKVLQSGLLLVNGPFYLNSCPLRRISQRYVICTKTRVNLKGVALPEHINDTYFKRAEKKKPRKTEGDIFAKQEEKYTPSEQRKKDQIEVDKLVRGAIKKTYQGLLVSKYLKSSFALRNHQYPHRMRY